MGNSKDSGPDSIRTSDDRAKRLPAGLRMFQERANQFLQDRLGSVFDHVDDTFFDLADNAESQRRQTIFFDAMRALRLARKGVISDFGDRLAVGFERLAGGKPPAPEKPESANNPASLQVLDNEELEEIIAVDTMVSSTNERCKKSLALLSRRVGSVAQCDLEKVRNPVAPEFVADSFTGALHRLEMVVEPKLVLLKLFERYVLNDLPNLIEDSNQMFKDMGVLPNLEEKLKREKQPEPKKEAPKPKTNKHTAAEAAANSHLRDSGNQSDDGVPQSAVGDQRATPGMADSGYGAPSRGILNNQAQYGDVLYDLHARLTGQQSRVGARIQVPEVESPVGVDELEEVLNEVRDTLADHELEETLSRKSIKELLGEQLAARNRSADSINQVDNTIIQLVDQLFDRVGSSGLPKQFQSFLRHMELPVARIALKDPSFFEKENHPARRLLNEIARSSTGLGAGSSSEKDPLYRKVQEIVGKLEKVETDVRKISDLLSEFITFVEKDRRRISMVEQRLLEEEAAREKVNEAHSAVAVALVERLVGREYPAIFVNFAQQAWCKVLFLSYLKKGAGSEQWRSALDLLDHLLDAAAAHGEGGVSARAGELPSSDELLGQAKDRLSEISFDGYEAGRFLGAMEQYFKTPVDSRSEEHEETRIEKDFGPVKVEQVQPDLPGQSVVREDAVAQLDPDCLERVDALPKGTWLQIEGEGDEEAMRCKLIGVIRPTGKYIFANRAGNKVAEDYRYRLAVKMQAGKLIVLDSSHLFDEALKDVVSSIHNRKKVA